MQRKGYLRRDVVLQRSPTSHRFTIYQDDPVGFVTNVLEEHLWSKQRDILQSLVACRRTAVKSCHDAGKSFIASRAASGGAISGPNSATLATIFGCDAAMCWQTMVPIEWPTQCARLTSSLVQTFSSAST